MGKHAAPAPEESVSVNVVPLVDIMFLLLLFLMVGGDMSHRESTELMLPKADRAIEADREAAGKSYTVINIHPIHDATSDAERLSVDFRRPDNWQFAISGLDYPDFWTLVDGDGPGGARPGLTVIGAQKVEETPVEGTKPPIFLSQVFVTIRADKDAPYGMIQTAMQACAEAHLYKIEVGAAMPAK